MRKLLYFSADYCNPCRVMEPSMSKLATQIHIEKIDIEANRDEINLRGIKTIPTLILIQDGLEIKRSHGLKTYDELLKFIS